MDDNHKLDEDFEIRRKRFIEINSKKSIYDLKNQTEKIENSRYCPQIHTVLNNFN